MPKKERNSSPSIREQGRVAVSMMEFKKAFTEWDRRYREEPERFMPEAEHLLKETPNTYGDACAPYFMKLINEVKTGEIA